MCDQKSFYANRDFSLWLAVPLIVGVELAFIRLVYFVVGVL